MAKRYSSTERLGVNYVNTWITKNDWIFREQPFVDVGVDAHVEVVDSGNPTGRMVALQIKSGANYLDDKGDHFVFRGNRVHLDYWLNHVLPVFLIVYLPDSDMAYWEEITKKNVKETGKGWKIYISKNNELNMMFLNAIEKKAGIPNKLTVRIFNLLRENRREEARRLLHDNWKYLDDVARLIECSFLMSEKQWQQALAITDNIQHKSLDVVALQRYYILRAYSSVYCKNRPELRSFLENSIDEINELMAKNQFVYWLRNPLSNHIHASGNLVDLLYYGGTRFELIYLAHKYFPADVNFEKFIRFSLMPHGFGISKELRFARTDSVIEIVKHVISSVRDLDEVSFDLGRAILDWFEMVHQSLLGKPRFGDNTSGAIASTNPEALEDDLAFIGNFIDKYRNHICEA